MTTQNKPNRFAAWAERLKHFSARDVVHGLESAWERFKQLIEKAQHTYYRLVVLNHDTFEEVGSYRLSLMNFYVLVSSLFVGLTIFGIVLVVFTPIKRIIPGYGGVVGTTERSIYELSERADSLERALDAQQKYINNFRKMLTGDVETERDVPQGQAQALKDSNFNTEVSEAEMIIRAGGSDPDEDVGGGSSDGSNAGKAIRVSLRNERLESMFLIPPVNGDISKSYDPQAKHYGIDITAPKNTPIKSTADGFVISSDWTLETGNTIAIQHANNVVSFYKHNASLLKKVGDKVKSGEAIAIIGNTGEQTTGQHLHFELWKDGRPVNPTEYIRF